MPVMIKQTSFASAHRYFTRTRHFMIITVAILLSACANSGIPTPTDTPPPTITTISSADTPPPTIITISSTDTPTDPTDVPNTAITSDQSTDAPNAAITSDQLTPDEIATAIATSAPTVTASLTNQDSAKWEYAQLIGTGKKFVLELPDKEISADSLEELSTILTGEKESINNTTAILNFLGNDRWELVSFEIAVFQDTANVYGSSSSADVWVFKRQK